MVEGLECLTGAVGLLSWYTALICIQGGGVVLGVFGAATPRQGAVPTILQIHAEVGWGRDAGEEMEVEEKEMGMRGDGGAS